MFEGKAHKRQEEKENLIKFLNTPPTSTEVGVDSEGGEA